MSDVLFKKVDYTVNKLLEDIDIGNIGLPDIQRPFVWSRSRVRDLFDSMYRGFPIGYLLFWENGLPGGYHTIGTEVKQKVPNLLIVDGQQRLTALYAVMRGKPVVDQDFNNVPIRLAFNPSEERFEVTNPAIERDPEWIVEISALWASSTGQYTLIQQFINRLAEKRPLSDTERERIHMAITRLVDLKNYPMTSLEISSTVNEEQVSEIFVRINSQGISLNLADFILTLMSVFWEEGRKDLEAFCRAARTPAPDSRPSPYNPYLQPDPGQLLRTSVALGFRRVSLEYVYLLLRGKDLQTRAFSQEKRDEQFSILRSAQGEVLNLTNWHEFFKVLQRAGYVHPGLITSERTVLFIYALWLIGKRDFHVNEFTLREIMAQWLFMASLTARYTASEGRLEQDLDLLRQVTTPEDFIHTWKQQMAAVLTPDYWEVTLPNELATSSARNTGQSAFYASLCILDAPVLYSKLRVRDLLHPAVHARKSALERHHLFPRRYLQRIGIQALSSINQIANYTLVEWTDNVAISDRSPEVYAPQMEQRFTPEELARMYRLHGLPEQWYRMPYPAFLEERRRRIAAIIRRGFEHLQGHPDPECTTDGAYAPDRAPGSISSDLFGTVGTSAREDTTP